MKKESEKYIDSNLFEGIVSIRAIAESILAGTTDRRFTRMLVAKEKVKSKAKELGWLKYLSSSMHRHAVSYPAAVCFATQQLFKFYHIIPKKTMHPRTNKRQPRAK